MQGDNISLTAKIWQKLHQIYDPEIPLNIVELGLIYDLTVNDEQEVQLTMTLTNPNCPVADAFPCAIRTQIESVPGVMGVEVQLVWEPPWDQSKMTETARLQLGLI
jgi:FeS assembly SUF system protein